jgi:hypothetical protein
VNQNKPSRLGGQTITKYCNFANMENQEKEYVTKRLLKRGSKRAFKTASKEAMKANGYIVVVADGWLVKEYADGRIERLEELDTEQENLELILD